MALSLFLLAAVLVGTVLLRRPLQAQSTALLSIPSAVVATAGMSVTVPIAFASGGNAVAGLTFSIDFDESCLAFDARDDNNDAQLDHVRITIPAAFQRTVSYDRADLDGELEVTIADYSLPLATLPDHSALVTVRFSTLCAPEGAAVVTAPVRFSTAPSPSFGGVNGRDVAGASQDGAVLIYGPLANTPTAPAPTLTPTASATATPGPGTPTAVAATPTSTQTPVGTPGTPTPTVTGTIEPTTTPATPTPTLIATGTPQPTRTPPRLYMPLVVR